MTLKIKAKLLRYGRLVAVSRFKIPAAGGKDAYFVWKCKCDCGSKAVVREQSLRDGKTQSCGCLQRERSARGNASPMYGQSTHEDYSRWARMKDRCSNPNNPKYPRYGGRGIKVCDRWLHDFSAFLADMGPKPEGDGWSIDRIDNDGDYCPENCRWASALEQANNTSNNHPVEYNAKVQNINQLAKDTGIDQTTIHMRLARGMTIKQAVETPIKQISTENRGRIYEHGGKRMTLFAWADEIGIKPKTLCARLASGKSFEEAIIMNLREVQHRNDRYEYNGKLYTIAELVNITGIPNATLSRKLRQNGCRVVDLLPKPKPIKIRIKQPI